MIYFAYGSNLDLDQITTRCPSAEPLESARLHGHRLAFAGCSATWGGAVATVICSSRATVEGGLYWMTDDDAARLDQYEGAAYQRRLIHVEIAPDRFVEAVTYVQRAPVEAAPTAAYLARIRSGYENWEIPTDDLDAVTPAYERLVAVYGSLLSGLGNHSVISAGRLVGHGRSVVSFEMASFGSFPGCRVVRRPTRHAGPIRVEVYAVTADTLEGLDRLEGHPNF